MAEFFKNFGKGILYLFVLPFIIVILIFYGLYGLGIFLVYFVKTIIRFFSGRELREELPEDIKAKEILDARARGTQAPVQKEEKPVSVFQPTINIYGVPPQQTKEISNQILEQGLFGNQSNVIDDPNVVDVEPTKEVIEETPSLAIEEKVEEPVKEEERPEPVFERPIFEEKPFEEEVNEPDMETIDLTQNSYKPLGEDDIDMNDIKADGEDEDIDDSGVSFGSF